ncbi:hypothetical protein E5288_WYG005105 [Bos mutus]|uniref:Uncharacterized protein n=1 Tax=Bos mutus TaxID=72004 RepID=A0A6B0RZ30_9CETA|nr:hypothetical protein [Bos mutus]
MGVPEAEFPSSSEIPSAPSDEGPAGGPGGVAHPPCSERSTPWIETSSRKGHRRSVQTEGAPGSWDPRPCREESEPLGAACKVLAPEPRDAADSETPQRPGGQKHTQLCTRGPTSKARKTKPADGAVASPADGAETEHGSKGGTDKDLWAELDPVNNSEALTSIPAREVLGKLAVSDFLGHLRIEVAGSSQLTSGHSNCLVIRDDERCEDEHPAQPCPSPVSPWIQEEPGAQESPCWSPGTDFWTGRHQSP